MSVTDDIVATWRRPRAVMARHLAQGVREDRAVAFLFAACALIFVSQLPRLIRADTLSPDDVPLQAELATTFFAWLLVWPVLFYLIAGLSHLAVKPFGGRGSFYGARLALFWSLLATTPAWLLYGLVTGFIGPGIQANITGGLLIAAFLVIWSICLREAETRPEEMA